MTENVSRSYEDLEKALAILNIDATAALHDETTRLPCPREHHAPFVRVAFREMPAYERFMEMMLVPGDLAGMTEEERTAQELFAWDVTNEDTGTLCGQWAIWVQPFVEESTVQHEINVEFPSGHLPAVVERLK